jgi:hypothetical protein
MDDDSVTHAVTSTKTNMTCGNTKDNNRACVFQATTTSLHESTFTIVITGEETDTFIDAMVHESPNKIDSLIVQQYKMPA